MKTESNIQPITPYEITFMGDIAEVVLFENIKKTSDENGEQTKWTWDEYRIRVNNRPELISNIENGFEVWLTAAKTAEYENLAKNIREKRDKLLTEYDWTQSLDSPLPVDKKAEWAIYRQLLRDITKQPNFPYDVLFPIHP